MSNNDKRFVESVPTGLSLVESEEANVDGPWKIRGVGLTADVINGNNRIYPAAVVREGVEYMRTHLHESAGQGRMLQVLGEAEHPSSKGRRPFIQEVVVNWTDVTFDGHSVHLEGNLLGTSLGKDVRAAWKGGVVPGLSARGYGESEMVEIGEQTVERVTKISWTGFDLTATASDPVAAVHYMESQQATATLTDSLNVAGGASAPDTTASINTQKPTQEEKPMADEKKEEKNTTEAAPAKEESQTSPLTTEQGAVDLAALRKQYPELMTEIAEQIQAEEEAQFQKKLEAKNRKAEEEQAILEAREASIREALGLGDTDDLLSAMKSAQGKVAEYEEKERAAEVQSYVEETVNAVSGWPEDFKKRLIEDIMGDAPESKEEAKQLIVRRRKVYDSLLADLKMKAMGMGADMTILGPVLESETGHPEFARPSVEINESLVRRGFAPRRDFRKPQSVNEAFAGRYLHLYDQTYKPQLVQESRLFAEAEQTTDLNLPYSVMRAVIAEAFPQLVATSVFDVDTMETSPMRLYFEAYAAETGHTVAITDEAVTSDEGAWVALANKRIEIGSVNVEPDGGGTAYVEGTDYVIDYANGEFFTLAAGSIGDSTALDVDYDYYAYRKGEMAPVERAKQTLTYVTIEAAADRLATQISDEAIVFSRSQLNWDATARTINSLVQNVRRRIDEGLIYMGLAGALSIASNSGGSWDSSTDDVELLIDYLGVAKVLVLNRYYVPTFILTSATNADLISRSSQASAAGARADFALAPNGFATRVKGLDVVASTEMSDSYCLVGNRELVMHRIFKPMNLKGPFPSYADAGDGTNKLEAADQYYVEEYNATESPVPEKGATVAVS